MIKSVKSLSLAEVREVLDSREETDKTKAVIAYAKKFTKLTAAELKNIKQDLEQLGIIKLKEEHIAKIIDVMPADAEDVRKIFTDVSLEENEITKILDVSKKYI